MARRFGPCRARLDGSAPFPELLSAEAAHRNTGAPRYLRIVEAAYGWFLGDNEVGAAVADHTSGSCRDGLTTHGVNVNEGAESTLMWLTALEHVRGIRAAYGSAAASVAPGSAPAPTSAPS